MLQNLRNKLKDNKGFSLVELIVVIAIMVILIALLVPQVTGQIKKAREAGDKNNAKAIYTAATTAIADAASAGQDIDTLSSVDEISFEDADGTHTFEEYVPNLDGGSYEVVIENGKVISATFTNKNGGEATYPESDEE